MCSEMQQGWAVLTHCSWKNDIIPGKSGVSGDWGSPEAVGVRETETKNAKITLTLRASIN